MGRVIINGNEPRYKQADYTSYLDRDNRVVLGMISNLEAPTYRCTRKTICSDASTDI